MVSHGTSVAGTVQSAFTTLRSKVEESRLGRQGDIQNLTFAFNLISTWSHLVGGGHREKKVKHQAENTHPTRRLPKCIQ